MLTVRLAEEKVSEVYPTDKIQSPVHLSTGQEAVAAGVCRALRAEDRLYGTYRGHALYIAKGAPLDRMFAELYAKDTGCARGKGGSMHLAAPEQGLMGCSAVVASTIPIAVGDALASKMQGSSRIVVSFFGDGAVDTGVFFESVNFAALKGLPVVFVIENNGLAIHSRVEARHKQTDLYRVTEGLGLRGSRHDGNDVFKVYEAMSKAVQAVRRGKGPALVEFTTHRWQEHVGPASDLDGGFRARGEKKKALASDPLPKAKRALKARYKVPDRELGALESAAREDVARAVEYAEKSPFPPAGRLLEDVFL